ncbi:GFA domain-containing protein [Phanerochaete sordida]|uniref:GFA domain-containing protein n=1 Tax=Phanerochaete sordida TaxID=48140 RepID=A0A9P3LED1_9APHY|nr:GFA domain-containing protein [Phanerochaete sordida]
MSSQTDAPAEPKQYSGACHCGKFKYTFPHAPFENGEADVFSCNCSLCTAKGLLLLRIPAKDFTFTAGTLDELTRYEWNTGKYLHHFCPVCGTEAVLTYDEMVTVNVRTVPGLDLEKLKLKKFDGANLL